MKTYTVYHVESMTAVKSGLSITESVRLHNECGHVTYGIMSDAAWADIAALLRVARAAERWERGAGSLQDIADALGVLDEAPS
jgi:hypothetical protein